MKERNYYKIGKLYRLRKFAKKLNNGKEIYSAPFNYPETILVLGIVPCSYISGPCAVNDCTGRLKVIGSEVETLCGWASDEPLFEEIESSAL